MNPLANRGGLDLDELTISANAAKHQLARNQRLLSGFIHATKLPIRLRR
jgi:hypothetical protein